MTDNPAVVVRIARNRCAARRMQRQAMDDLLLATGRAPPLKGGAKAAEERARDADEARARLLADDDEPQGVSIRVKRSRKPGAPLVLTIGNAKRQKGARE